MDRNKAIERVPITRQRRRSAWLVTRIVTLLFLAIPCTGKASAQPDEITVYLTFRKMGIHMPALLDGENLYMPVSEVFRFLKIKTMSTDSLNKVRVFLPDENTEYQINYLQKQISCRHKSFPLSDEEIIRGPNDVFLRTDVFQRVFELECRFDFRNLAVIVNTKMDLPILRELQQNLLHSNLQKLKKEVEPDSIIKRRFSLIRLGTADWSVIHTSSTRADANSRMSLKMGGMIAGGGAMVSLNYDNKIPAPARQQLYQWRWVNNHISALRQATVGNISPHSALSIFAPVTGVQLTNTPTLRKQSFGTYTISDNTEPGTTIELYINNLLIDYTKADASGFYTFNVPMFYGNNNIKLKFYSPSGQERSNEKELSIPFQLLPKNAFEYNVSAGVVNDKTKSRYAKAVIQYGIGQRATISAGMEHLSSIPKRNSIPFLATTIRASPNTILSTEYLHGVKSKTTLGLRLPSNFQLEAGYTRYVRGQKAILTSYLEERKLALSLPWQNSHFLLLSKLAIRQVVSPLISSDSLLAKRYSDIPKQNTTNIEMNVAAVVSRLNASMTTYGTRRHMAHPYLYTNLSVAYRLNKGYLLQSFAQFSYDQGKFISVKEQVAKQLFGRGAVTISCERIFSSKRATFTIGVQYDFRSAKTATSFVHNGNANTLVSTSSGSLLYSSGNQSFSLNNRSQVGRGGILLNSFLDFNCNGVQDKNEPGIGGLKFRFGGGRVLSGKHGSFIQIVDLEPYRNYLIELDGDSFGNIAWQLKNKRLSVEVEPNCIKQIDIPVAVLGEVSGMIYLNKDREQKGLSKVLVKFYDASSTLVAQTLSESDGYFSFLGLAPGVYKAEIDQSVIQKLQLSGVPSISFTVEESTEGTIIRGLKFIFHSTSNN